VKQPISYGRLLIEKAFKTTAKVGLKASFLFIIFMRRQRLKLWGSSKPCFMGLLHDSLTRAHALSHVL